ncbi:hypothetical protein KUH32_00735 [Thalassococcus sp. CAU 1522]|uniref:Lipoprotein n=1 Tax=Thalassococcus arenae TaxID=2851652 RepID=A0ABS6N2M6_9RHOB|nr:hypothetical protein [Thalassococcus arenae]MBV2358287.1 hypothetical protein [Thalassococcus arenae]
MRLISVSVVFGLTLAGCAAPPASEMERRTRMAAAAEVSATQCAGFVGGYESAKQLKADANTNIIAARQLGATDADLAKARKDVQTTFNTAALFTSIPEACNSLIGSLAWTSN